MRSIYGFGGNLASSRSQTIDLEFLQDKTPSTLQEKASFLL
jgi:hypothetical protein